jgi:hypothetical protein
MLLNEQEVDQFFKNCNDQYEEDTQFLINHGWKKLEDNLWISPKGTKCKHHLGFFLDEDDVENGIAIDVAKHEIVLDQFDQFKVEIYYEGDEQPHDLVFPCIKDGKLYSYGHAVDIAVYNINDTEVWERDMAIFECLNDLEIHSGDIIKINQLFTDDYKFELRK